MKTKIKAFIVVLLLNYLFFSFITWNLNPAEWNNWIRFFSALVFISSIKILKD